MYSSLVLAIRDLSVSLTQFRENKYSEASLLFNIVSLKVSELFFSDNMVHDSFSKYNVR
jgi:hypothetical protein